MLAVLIQVTAGKVMRSGGTWQYTFHQQVTIKHQNVIVIVLIHRLVLVKNYYFITSQELVMIILLIIMIAEL